jgi:hypothetical protein
MLSVMLAIIGAIALAYQTSLLETLMLMAVKNFLNQ